ncbi:MAG: gamma-glutamyltransferase family protein [Betaproteobacteria bacterium]
MTNQLLPFATRWSVRTACLLLLGSSVAFAKNKAPQAPAKADTEKAGTPFQHRGVASANPMASAAGLQILKAGGSAVDAAIAVQLVLTLVEPQSSGIGGGAFLVHDDGKQLQVFDGRETAPLLAPSDMFMLNGKAQSFNDVVTGGRAVGVPGLLRMLALAHKQHGKLPWAALFKPAIQIAEAGFPISPRLHALLKNEPTLLKDPQSVAYFFKPNGTPLPVGHRLTNPGLAKVYKLIAKEGADAFYTGALAQTIVNRVQQYANNPGLLTMADMQKYRPEVREALCFSHSSTQSDGKTVQICGAGAPSSGLIAMGQIFGMLSAQARPADDMQSVDWLHNYNEAARLAFADRAQFVADPAFVTAPGKDWGSMLQPAYLQQRAELISPRRMADAPAGNPGNTTTSYAPMADQPEYGTSHISVVDGQGRAVSMTTSIESGFGARLMVSPGLRGGFLLNNQLTDFSFAPRDANGVPVANRLQAGKRPRSSMNPILVYASDAGGQRGPLMANLGSPGGPMIIHYTSQTLWAMLNGGLDAQAAIKQPHSGISATNGPLMLESGRFPAATVDGLKARGHEVQQTEMPSGLQAIQRKGEGWLGAADPRREGSVSGD